MTVGDKVRVVGRTKKALFEEEGEVVEQTDTTVTVLTPSGVRVFTLSKATGIYNNRGDDWEHMLELIR